MKPHGHQQMNRRPVSFPAICIALIALLSGCHAGQRTNLTVSAAASLQSTLGQVEAAYFSAHPDVDFRNNFGSSGTLALEIEQGAPVDIFVSAAAEPMDHLESKGLIVAGSRKNILHNSLVLIAPLDSKLQRPEELADASTKIIAVGDPASVPAGKYAQQVLNALQLNDRVKAKLVLGKDVRQVLTLVETGNADAGFVYATDAEISSRVRVVATLPESAHEPIIYPAAVVKPSSNQKSARSFVDFLAGSEARAIFTRNGYTLAAP